jgi:hypothetical protein
MRVFYMFYLKVKDSSNDSSAFPNEKIVIDPKIQGITS